MAERTINLDTFGIRLIAAMKRARISGNDLATAMGVTPRTVSSWRHDHCTPSREDVKRLADILGVAARELDYGFALEEGPAVDTRYPPPVGLPPIYERLVWACGLDCDFACPERGTAAIAASFSDAMVWLKKQHADWERTKESWAETERAEGIALSSISVDALSAQFSSGKMTYSIRPMLVERFA